MSSYVIPLIINGEDVTLSEDGSKTTFEANPDLGTRFPSRPLWTTQGATPELAIRAVNSCSEAFQSWSKTPLTKRRALFLNLAQVLRMKSAELSSIIEEEICCSKIWASTNVNNAIGLAEHVASLSSSTALLGLVPEIQNPKSHGVVFKAPLGVILGIAPWNAPAILGLRAVAAAVMAGNCAILKGSELSPRTHYFIANAFRQAGFPPGVVNFLVHKPENAATIFETIISQDAVRKCNFTGSTAVGRQIAMRAAFHLKPVLLELGGKNYVIVLDDADCDTATDMILEGAFRNSGQICMSTDMVLASSKVKPELCRLLREKLQESSSRHVTELISLKSDVRIEKLLKDAADKGARIHSASKGRRTELQVVENCDGPVTYRHGTIIENVTPQMEFWEQESFGPLVGITTCESFDEAVRIVNACPYGLSAAIFSKAGVAVVDQARRLQVGAVHINGATVHDEPNLPHGGCRESGWGRFGGHWALEEFVQTQTVIVN